jgi:hypothetical protein
MKPVVRSLLETDLYKFTMWQALLHMHPNAIGEYEFKCRNTPAYPLAELKEDVERELDHLCDDDVHGGREVDYLRSLRFIKSDFADFLTLFRFQRKFIEVTTDGPHLRIHASRPDRARDGLRDLRALHRQRAVFPPLRPGRRAGRGTEAPGRRRSRNSAPSTSSRSA